MFRRRMIRGGRLACWLMVGIVLLPATMVAGDEATAASEQAIRYLADTRIENCNSQAARLAWDQLVECDAAVLPEILAAMKNADAVGVNWLRTAFDAIALRERRSASPQIPWPGLRAAIFDPQYDVRARQLAMSLLESEQPGTTKRLLPTLLEDPAFRLQAIEALIAEADAALKSDQEDHAKQICGQALAAAVDHDQIMRIAQCLENLGEKIDRCCRLGVPKNWQVLGPFPGHEMTGFNHVYPPEKQVELDASYPGVSGEIVWKHASPAADGEVDLNGIFGVSSDTVAYAYCVVAIPEATQAALLAGADDNLAVWLNGQRVFAFAHYHQHLRPDRHRIPVRLEAGENTLLLKVCQSTTPPDQQRPNEWQFLLRLVDPEGKPLQLSNVKSARDE